MKNLMKFKDFRRISFLKRKKKNDRKWWKYMVGLNFIFSMGSVSFHARIGRIQKVLSEEGPTFFFLFV